MSGRTAGKPVHPRPIPPKSVVRIARADGKTPFWKKELGRRFRVGYYTRQDGLDCVWLVNEDGKYEQSTDHEFLYKYFEIENISNETDFYGDKRPRLRKLTTK